MEKHPILVRGAAALALLLVVTGAYLLWARPYQLRWGATAAEVARSMPGDELHREPFFLATRAITIDGTPQEIWPWLLQMGYGRAGYYGFDLIENLGSERGLTSAERIVPELQRFEVGDEVPISAAASMVFHAIEPHRYLIWAEDTEEDPGAFTWALYPVAPGRTRLVSRIRWSPHWSDPWLLALELFTEFTDHLAVRKILHGVKDRVEGRAESMTRQNVELFLYVLLGLLFLVALGLLLLQPLTLRGWLAALAAGAAWLLGWYAPIPLWLGGAVAVAAAAGLLRACRAPAR